MIYIIKTRNGLQARRSVYPRNIMFSLASLKALIDQNLKQTTQLRLCKVYVISLNLLMHICNMAVTYLQSI